MRRLAAPPSARRAGRRGCRGRSRPLGRFRSPQAHFVISLQRAHLSLQLAAELPAARRQISLPVESIEGDVGKHLLGLGHNRHPTRPGPGQLAPPAGSEPDTAKIEPAPSSDMPSQRGRDGSGDLHLVPLLGDGMEDVAKASPGKEIRRRRLLERTSTNGKSPRTAPSPPRMTATAGTAPRWRMLSAAKYHSGVRKALPRAAARRRHSSSTGVRAPSRSITSTLKGNG